MRTPADALSRRAPRNRRGFRGFPVCAVCAFLGYSVRGAPPGARVPLTDVEQLLTQAKSGDRAVLGRLLEAHRPFLRLLARLEVGPTLGGRLDASDVVQETFLRACEKFDGFRGDVEAQFAEWLRRVFDGVLSNLVRRHLGTQARDARLERSLDADDGSARRAAAGVPDGRSSPSQRAARGERATAVLRAVARLPDDYQAVLVHRHWQGRSFHDVAAAMGRSVDAVEKLWVRALARLKRENAGLA